MLIIENQSYLEEVVAFAKKVHLYESDSNASLKNRLDYLARYGGKKQDGSDKTRARLFKDGAPYSFGFVIEALDANGDWTTAAAPRAPSRCRSRRRRAGPSTPDRRTPR
jgi:hypothetical protein